MTSSIGSLSIDLFYPRLNIAFEYQVYIEFSLFSQLLKGQQHYKFVNLFHRHANPMLESKQRDADKYKFCREKGKNSYIFLKIF
jgi:hypothetical protein